MATSSCLKGILISYHSNSLDSFEPVTEAEVNKSYKILKNQSKKICSLDAVPTWLIIESADSLTPAITSIVNCS